MLRYVAAGALLLGCGSTSDPTGFAAGSTATGGAAPIGCTTDADCKGDRICAAGQCANPGTGGTTASGGSGSGGKALAQAGRGSGGSGSADGGAAPIDAGDPPQLDSGTGGALGAGGSGDAGSYRCDIEPVACAVSATLTNTGADCWDPDARVRAANGCFPLDCACAWGNPEANGACIAESGTAGAKWCSDWKAALDACAKTALATANPIHFGSLTQVYQNYCGAYP